MTTHLRTLPLLLALAACAGGFDDKGEDPQGSDGGDEDTDGDADTDGDTDGDTDTDTDGGDTEVDPAETDDDGDGLSEAEGDCDDEDPDVGPGEAETPYDGVDNDCDESTPDDDLDGDGYGIEDDCDDTDPEVSPAEAEVPYDGLDNDCDEESRDDDLDGDGYGIEDDCDDTEKDANPGQAEDITDGIDNDCDGETDERFTTVTLDTTCDCGEAIAVGVDSGDQFHAAYYNGDTMSVRYRSWQGGVGWSSPADILTYSGASVGDYMDAAVDNADNFQLAFTYYDLSTGALDANWMLLDATGTWSADYIVEDESSMGSSSLGHFISIDTDSSNLPSFAWYDDDAGLPYVADFSSIGVSYTVNADECLDPTGILCPVYGSGYYTSVAVDSADGLWVAYHDADTPTDLTDDGKAQYTYLSNSLTDPGIAFSEDAVDDAIWTDIEISPAGDLCMVWQDQISADLGYGCLTASGWSTEIVDSAGSVGAYAKLAFNSGSEPYIAYYDATNGDLKMAHDDGTGWSVFTVDDGDGDDVGLYVDIAVDSRGRVHAAYRDETNGVVRYARGR